MGQVRQVTKRPLPSYHSQPQDTARLGEAVLVVKQADAVLFAQAAANPDIMEQAGGVWDCALILEARLLPKLDPRSKLSLAATNQELCGWLFALPPAVWQVGSFLKQLSHIGQHICLSAAGPCAACMQMQMPHVQCHVQPARSCRCLTYQLTPDWVQDMQSLGVGNDFTATLPTTGAILEGVRAARACQQGVRSEQQPSLLWAEPLPQTSPGSCQEVFNLCLSPDSVHCVVHYNQVAMIVGTRLQNPQKWWLGAVRDTHRGAEALVAHRGPL